jgi:hypothetical protein
MGVPETDPSYYVEAVVDNTCDYRIWLHQIPGKAGPYGEQACVNPGQQYEVNQEYVYAQVQETYTQAPCDAGSSPYPPT